MYISTSILPDALFITFRDFWFWGDAYCVGKYVKPLLHQTNIVLLIAVITLEFPLMCTGTSPQCSDTTRSTQDKCLIRLQHQSFAWFVVSIRESFNGIGTALFRMFTTTGYFFAASSYTKVHTKSIFFFVTSETSLNVTKNSAQSGHLWVSKPEWAAFIRTWRRFMCNTFPKIHLWCNICQPLGGQNDSLVILFYVPVSRHWWRWKPGSVMPPLWGRRSSDWAICYYIAICSMKSYRN